jgi:large subunit ribosomal protein L25
VATARPTLDATRREITGKKVARLRNKGKLPGVVFGRGVESSSVTVDTHAFEQLRRRTGPNTLIDLSVDGKKPDPVLVSSVQIHPVTRRPLHVDLFLVRMTEELTVDVRVETVGESPAVTIQNGTLQTLDHVRVRALPDHLPSFLQISVDSLVDFETMLHVRDLEIPADVTLLTDPDEVLAKVLPPRIEVEEVAPAAEEGEEGEEAAEGAEGAAATGQAGEEGPSERGSEEE